jgi:hypothetical protein
LKPQQLICWAKLPDAYKPYLLPSQPPSIEDIKFQEDLRKVSCKSEAFDLFSSCTTLSLRRKWRCIYILSKHCEKLKDLRYYFIEYLRYSITDCKKLRDKIQHLMSRKDIAMWDRLVPPASLQPTAPLLSSPLPSPSASLVPVKTQKKRLIKLDIATQLSLSISSYELVSFLGEGAWNNALGIAITFGSLFIFVVLSNALAKKLFR